MSAEQPEARVGRRRFLNLLVGGVGGLIAAALAVPLLSYFLSPAFRKSTRLLTPIARKGDIPLGQPTFVNYEQRVRDGWNFTTLKAQRSA